jgi:hypothetical protein
MRMQVTMHTMMGKTVQPRDYIAFVNLYHGIFDGKKNDVVDQKRFLKVGGHASVLASRVLSNTLSPPSHHTLSPSSLLLPLSLKFLPYLPLSTPPPGRPEQAGRG